MGSEKTLLIVDPDTRSLRVLEVSLRKAGFRVMTAETAEAAGRIALQDPPDVLVTDTQLPDEDGHALARRIREEATGGRASVIFLSAESSPDAKMRAIEAGADDFLAKPVLVKEIVSRIRSIVATRPAEALDGGGRDGHLRGRLANMGVVDILQVMEAGAKSGVVHLSSTPARSGGYVTQGEARATLYFRDGRLVDGQLGGRSGAEALYRVFLWEDGDFEVELVDIDRPDLVGMPTQHLLLEGMRRVDEWGRLLQQLPHGPGRQPTVDYAALGRRFGELPGEVRSVVHLLDGQRSLFQVVDQAPVDDATAVGIILRLHEAGVLVVDESPSEPPKSIEAWLAEPPEPVDIPPALGQAMIPSERSPSEILAAADPLRSEHASDEAAARSETETETVPSPSRRPRSASIVLSRRTVPANRRGPLAGEAEAAARDDGDDAAAPRPPRLSIQKVSSIIQPASPLAQGADERADTEVTRESTVPPAFARAIDEPTRSSGLGIGIGGHEVGRGRADQASGAWTRPFLSSRTASVDPAMSVRGGEPEPFEPFEPFEPRGRAPDRVPPPGALPTEDSGLFISDRRPPSTNGHTGRSLHPPGGAPTEPRRAPPRERRPGLAAATEEDFFAGHGPPSSEVAQDVDWGDAPPKSLVERLAPWALILTVVFILGFLIATSFMGKDAGGGASAELEAQVEAEAKAREDLGAGRSTPSGAPVPGGRAAPANMGAAAREGASPTEEPDDLDDAPRTGAMKPSVEAPLPTEGVSREPSGRSRPASPVEALPDARPEAVRPSPSAPAATDARLPRRAPERPRSGEAEAALRDAEEALRSQDFTAAKSRFRTATRLDRGLAAARSGLAYTHLAEEDLKAAYGEAIRALERDPEDARANYVLGVIAQLRGNMKEACRRYARYLELGGGPQANEVRSIRDQKCGG